MVGLEVPAGLGLVVQQSTKDNIAQGQYVDMSLLLPGTIDLPQGNKFGLSADGQFMITPAAGWKITTIEEWSDAFLVYSSWYLATHPSETPAIMKYLSTIRLAAKCHLGLGWQSYDTVYVTFSGQPTCLLIQCNRHRTLAPLYGPKHAL